MFKSKNLHFYLLLVFLFSDSLIFCEKAKIDKKILICGVCRNVEPAVANTIKNIESLGKRFADYAAIIYENNSTDRSAELFTEWAAYNPRVDFSSEYLTDEGRFPTAFHRIARARNIVMEKARDPKYDDFDYILWVDPDFLTPWPIREIINTVNSPVEWDCVSANGILHDRKYYDIIAYRDAPHPFGPEMLDKKYFMKMARHNLHFEGENFIPVYSAFCGLAIYKRESIINFDYSPETNEDYVAFYRKVLTQLTISHPEVYKYLKYKKIMEDADLSQAFIPLGKKCCEHVTLHASMSMHGYNKHFINPKMYMYYRKGHLSCN